MRFKTIFVIFTVFSSSDTVPLNSAQTAILQLLFATYCQEVNCLHLEPQLTDLLLAVCVGVRVQGPLVPLWLDLPLSPGVSEATAVALGCSECCLKGMTKWCRHLQYIPNLCPTPQDKPHLYTGHRNKFHTLRRNHTKLHVCLKYPYYLNNPITLSTYPKEQ
jgi:hypothetical protein